MTLGSFGDRLREYREHRGWSLGDLSRATTYSRGYLSNIEHSRKRPTEDLARRCDEALRAKGELISAARTDAVARLDQTPWQTAELIRRLQMSDTTPGTLEALHATVTELCCQYSYRDALDLRGEAQDWLAHVGTLLRRPVGLGAHGELLVAAGWLALLTGCVEYDAGMRASAEATRTAALQIGTEASHGEITGWAHEMAAWFALTQGRFRNVITAARQGQAAAQNTSVHVQLIAQEAKARARTGETGLQPLLERGREMLARLPYPERPDHHFQIDPAKWDYYAMDVHRFARDNELAEQAATTVIRDNLAPDGGELSPMRIAESRLTLGVVACRTGDLEHSVALGLRSLTGDRKSLPSLRMVAAELEAELEARYPREPLTSDFQEAVKAL